MARYSTARYTVKEAHEAVWARRIALFFVQLLILTVLLHRFASLSTPAAINLLVVSLAGLLIAIAIAVGSLIRIWFGGQSGASHAVAAVFIACLGLALPGYYLAKAARLPMLTDVQTSPDEPLEFTTLNTMRPANALPLKDPTPAQIDAQDDAYPDLDAMTLERSAPEVFSIVHEAVDRLGWDIVVNEPPGETGIGHIEATARSLIMGFTNDVVIQIKGDDAHAQIDARSVSRYGMTDFGANAKYIRKLFAEVSAALEKGEKTVLEQAEPKKDEAEKPKAIKKRSKKAANRKRSGAQ
ncbi:MAG TPA: DUF1499 domain-containing protein [Methyloceanibacter sp.]|jgi:hypothetical protein